MSHAKQISPPRKPAMNMPERPTKTFRGNAPSPSGSKRRAPMPRKATAIVSMPIRPNAQRGGDFAEPEATDPIESVVELEAAEPDAVATH